MPTSDPKVMADTQRAFLREFPRTEEGLALQLHAQIYFGYIPLYIYYMKLGMSQMIPEMKPLVAPEYPKGIEFDILDGMVKTAVNRCAHGAADLSTNTYHAKVVRLEEAEQVLTLKEDLNLGELPKTIMPYQHAVTAVIKNPERIAVIDCICRKLHGDEGCKPLDVCLVIGEPWVSWVMARDNRMNARLVTQEEALTILRETHERGNVHAVFFKDVAANRIYSICNCCPCCCTAIQAQNHLGAPMMARSGYTARIDGDKCIKCGICAQKCNFMAIGWNKGELPVVDEELCMGCEGCLQFCKQDAITLELTDPESPFNIKELMAKV
jgi:ferredoxin